MSKLSREGVFSSIVLAATVFAATSYASAAKPKVRLTMEAAKEIALTREAGDIKSQELEEEKGRWIYSFDIKINQQMHEVGVDANTGEIVEDSVESPADEAKEKAKEHRMYR